MALAARSTIDGESADVDEGKETFTELQEDFASSGDFGVEQGEASTRPFGPRWR